MRKVLGCTLPLLCAAAIAGPGAGTAPDPAAVTSLRAFARLYGYVRFFHPSDEASEVDWDRFAIVGAAEAGTARTTDDIRRVLEKLFLPMAPTLRFYRAGEKPAPYALPADMPGLVTVFWRHSGVGLGEGSRPYLSWRMNRPNPARGDARSVIQVVDREELAGPEVRLAVRARTTCRDPEDLPCLWLSAPTRRNWMASRQNLVDCPVESGEWTRYSAEAALPEDANAVYVGVCPGSGELCADDIELWAKNDAGEWEPVELGDPGFEADVPLAGSDDWRYTDCGYRVERLARDDGTEGRCLFIAPAESGFFGTEWLAPGAAVERELAPGLWCHLPLALWSDAEHSLPRADAAAFARLREELGEVELDSVTGDDAAVRVAGVTIAWNVFRHFYPYFDVVDVDWDEVLTRRLTEALADTSALDFLLTLRRLTAALQDGHAMFHHMMRAGRTVPSCELELVEGRVIVTAVSDTTPLRRGDIILTADGEDAVDLLERKSADVSGSPRWCRYRTLHGLLAGPGDRPAELTVDRDGDTLALTVPRDLAGAFAPTDSDFVRELEPGIWFVDLNHATMAEIDSAIDRLAAARGVVFDLRRYPNSNHDIICHLIDEPVRSAIWNIPRQVYPDQENVVEWDTSGRWTLEPKEPRLRGRIAFLVSGGAISYAESFLGIVEHYRLGALVGEATAGTNGNVNRFTLPGGYMASWTGMKVLKHDGSQHHLVGIRPTVPVERTIAGVRAGRDEFLEKALEVVRAE